MVLKIILGYVLKKMVKDMHYLTIQLCYMICLACINQLLLSITSFAPNSYRPNE